MHRCIILMIGVPIGILVALMLRQPLQDLAQHWWQVPQIGRWLAIGCGTGVCAGIEEIAGRLGFVRPQSE
jgi:hypothetical protein